MWMAMRLKEKITATEEGTGKERNVWLANHEIGVVGACLIYTTKKQALANEEKGTPIIKVKECKE